MVTDRPTDRPTDQPTDRPTDRLTKVDIEAPLTELKNSCLLVASKVFPYKISRTHSWGLSLHQSCVFLLIFRIVSRQVEVLARCKHFLGLIFKFKNFSPNRSLPTIQIQNLCWNILLQTVGTSNKVECSAAQT